MSRRTPPNTNYPEWSDAKFWSFVRSGLRRKWIMWPPRFLAIQKSRRAVVGQRHKWEVKCAKCKKWWKLNEVQVDHKEPVGTLQNYDDLPAFVRRLFVAVDKLRILCKGCHTKITNKGRKQDE